MSNIGTRIYVKKRIINLCDDMIALWDNLEREISGIPNEKEADIVLAWKEFFPKNVDVISKFSQLKRDIDEFQDELIKHGELIYEDGMDF